MINTSNNKIIIDGGEANAESGLLGRCLLGHINKEVKEKPTLYDIRR